MLKNYAHADVAVKVAVNVPFADAAAQVALLVPPIPATHTAAHPSHEVHDHPHEAAPSQCDNPPKHDVQDMFCPDSQYLTVRQSIPQLDGSTDATTVVFAVHPGSNYALNIIPHFTKLDLVHRCERNLLQQT